MHQATIRTDDRLLLYREDPAQIHRAPTLQPLAQPPPTLILHPFPTARKPIFRTDPICWSLLRLLVLLVRRGKLFDHRLTRCRSVQVPVRQHLVVLTLSCPPMDQLENRRMMRSFLQERHREDRREIHQIIHRLTRCHSVQVPIR